jgi:RTX calcium-binding nonapeptide repeat (4 copies)
MAMPAADAFAPLPKPILLDLKSLLIPQVSDRIAAAEATKNQVLTFEQVPAPPATTQSSGTISSKDALTPAVGAEITRAEGTTNPALLPSAALPAIPTLASRTAASRSFAPLFNSIVGTPNNDDITGTDKNDYINGLQGDDTLRGGNGDDIVLGAEGNDIISGDHVPEQTTRSNDILLGAQGNDKLFGRIGDDTLLGGDDIDQLFGGSGRDLLYGGNGNDQLFGGIVEGDKSFNPFPDGADRLIGGGGDDYLEGGIGSDYLDGSDATLRGAGEQDILTGGEGADTFVLGSRAGAYYIQGGARQDFALMIGFEQSSDKVRLNGNASQYVLAYDSAANSTALGYLGSGSFELVGVFSDQDLSTMSLTSSTFQYVS